MKYLKRRELIYHVAYLIFVFATLCSGVSFFGAVGALETGNYTMSQAGISFGLSLAVFFIAFNISRILKHAWEDVSHYNNEH